jgi:hypothetical protein
MQMMREISDDEETLERREGTGIEIDLFQDIVGIVGVVVVAVVVYDDEWVRFVWNEGSGHC